MSEKLKPFTKEGLTAYYDQMADKDGWIKTTVEWLVSQTLLIEGTTERRLKRDRKAIIDGFLARVHERWDAGECDGQSVMYKSYKEASDEVYAEMYGEQNES